jgi:hypothetical protein
MRGLDKEDRLIDYLLVEQRLVFFPVRAALAIPVYWVEGLVVELEVVCRYGG